MFTNIKKFTSDESGAISVDWVVLTAAMVFLATAVAVSIRDTTIDTADVMSEKVAATPFKN